MADKEIHIMADGSIRSREELVIPESSFLDKLASEGHLRSQLQQVAREDGTHTRIIKLRRIFLQLQADPAKFVHLWSPFLDIFFDRNSVRDLTIDDVYRVERVGDTLLATSWHPEDIWSRTVLAYTLRGEEFQARSLLTRMFDTPSVHPSCKDWVAVELARRGAQDAEHLNIYIQYLYHVTALDHATEMINLLKPVCIVDFSSSHAQIEQAGKIASCLIDRQIWVTGVWKAKALHTLLIEQKPAEAVKPFVYAVQENMQDSVAFCGLLAAGIQCKKYGFVTEAMRLTEQIAYPLADALVKIGIVLQWLDNRYGIGTPLYTAQNLEDLKILKIQKYIGDTLDVAIGKLHLIEGNARQASAVLRPIAANHPEWPELQYYVAWADVLLDEHRALERRFLSLATWHGQWTVATLLLDANPNAAEIDPLWSCLEEKRNMKHHLTSVIGARMALMRGQAPEDISWKLNADSLLEEDMEALRTAIGCAIYMRDIILLEQLIALPLFRHLPLADQLLWRGLQGITCGQTDQGCAYLEDAVNMYGYRRAALVLTVYYLERDVISKAKYFLERASTVHTEKIALLRAYIYGQEGQVDMAVEMLKTRARQSEVLALHTLANLYLNRNCYSEAADIFDAAAKQTQHILADEYKVLACCARFVICPQPIDFWDEVQQLERTRSQTWLLWNATLARLWYGSPTAVMAICEHIAPMLEQAGAMKVPIALEVVRAVVQVCARIEQRVEADRLVLVLERIERCVEQKEVKHICQQGITIAAQKRYSKTSETDHLSTMRYIAGLVEIDSTNGSLTLLLASIYLTYNEPHRAIAVLKRACPLDVKEKKLCSLLAALLEKQNGLADEILPLHAQGIPEIIVAYDLLKALVAYSTESTALASKIVLADFFKDQHTTTTLVKIKQLLPYLCAVAIQERTLVLEQVQTIADSSGETKEMVTLARYMAAIGEVEKADHVWRVLIEKIDVKSPLRQEFAQLLCHISATNYNNGNLFTAIRKLRKALSWFKTTDERERYRKLLGSLESYLALYNLLTIMFPAMGKAYKLPGRYYGFIRFIKYFGQIRSFLIDEYEKNADAELARSVQEKMALCPDVRLIHLQAVIYRDFVSRHSNHQYKQANWVRSTTLWILLLCDEAFWAYFAVARSVNKQGERENLDEIEQDCLFYDALDTIFSEHMLRAKQAFAACHYEEAKIHLYCLDLCQRGEEALIAAMQEYDLTIYSFSLEGRRIDEVKQLADKIFKEWSDALLREAEKATKDKNALEILEVSRNFEGGIRVLETFIALDIPILHVLTTCLQWYNGWRVDLWRLGEYQQVIKLTDNAQQIADRLAPLCTRNIGYKKENQELSQHFFWRGTGFESDQICMRWYREALAWNPTNSNAQANLEELENKKQRKDGYVEYEHEENDCAEYEYEKDDYVEYEYDYEGGD